MCKAKPLTVCLVLSGCDLLVDGGVTAGNTRFQATTYGGMSLQWGPDHFRFVCFGELFTVIVTLYSGGIHCCVSSVKKKTSRPLPKQPQAPREL